MSTGSEANGKQAGGAKEKKKVEKKRVEKRVAGQKLGGLIPGNNSHHWGGCTDQVVSAGVADGGEGGRYHANGGGGRAG